MREKNSPSKEKLCKFTERKDTREGLISYENIVATEGLDLYTII